MSEEDGRRWDARYSSGGRSGDPGPPGIPAVFAPYEELFPRAGLALDLACGRGAASVWLATRGLEVCGLDASPAAIDRARSLATRYGVSGRCRFQVADLDQGLPPGPSAELVHCHMFRDPRLYRAMVERLKAGGLLAIAVLSEVGGRSGPFRAGAGELADAFGELDLLAAGEGEGRAWLLARKVAAP